MSEERLQEIKDSIEFQYTLAKIKGYDNALLFTNEEEELVEEIDRLNNIINELEKYMIKEQARIVINNTDEDEFIYTDLLIKLKELKDSD